MSKKKLSSFDKKVIVFVAVFLTVIYSAVIIISKPTEAETFDFYNELKVILN